MQTENNCDLSIRYIFMIVDKCFKNVVGSSLCTDPPTSVFAHVTRTVIQTHLGNIHPSGVLVFGSKSGVAIHE